MIYLTESVDRQIMHAVRFMKDKEVQGLGHVVERELEGKVYAIIDDILIPPQVVTGGNAETDIIGIEKTVFALAKLTPPQVLRDWRFHWHSHVSMSVSPSGVDTKNLEVFAEEVGDWAIGGVFNNRGDRHGWVAYRLPSTIPGSPFITGSHQMPIQVLSDIPKAEQDRVEKMITDNVEEKQWVPAAPTHGNSYVPGMGYAKVSDSKTVADIKQLPLTTPLTCDFFKSTRSKEFCKARAEWIRRDPGYPDFLVACKEHLTTLTRLQRTERPKTTVVTDVYGRDHQVAPQQVLMGTGEE